MLRLRFTRRFCMAHRLIEGQSKKCATPHGHNQLVTVELEPAGGARLDGSANMVAGVRRREIKLARLCRQSARSQPPAQRPGPTAGDRPRRVSAVAACGLSWRPTTELLAALLMAKCQALTTAALPEASLVCKRIELVETPTNAVIFEGDPAEVVPIAHGWWLRPDNSTR